MAYRELELTLLSAQELKSVNLITRMDVYAVVSISGHPLTRQCTEPDIYGGRNPCWNATFRFAVPPTATAAAGASLHVLLRAERFLGDRDVGEVVVPLSDVLASASGFGPQPPQVASYQVRKLHRWEPRGVLNVSYRLGPVVAPVLERAPEKPVYAPVGVPPQPSHQHPSAVAYQPPVAAAPGPPAVRVAEHDDAAQKKSPVVMAYPVSVPVPQQQASHPPAKPDAYRPPTPPSPRPAAIHAARREEAPAPAPAPARAPSPRNTRSNNGFGQPGPTHVYMGPHSQIIFGGVSAPTTGAGLPTRTTSSPARSIISPAGTKGDGNWALLTQGNYASAAEPVISPRRTKEDRWRPSELSQSQQQAARSPVAAPSPQRLAASPFSSRSSSFSSPLSPYSAHPSPSSSSSVHSSTRSPYTEATHDTNNTFHSRGAVISSPLPSSSSPMIPNHYRGAAVSSPLPSSSSPMIPNHYRGAAVSSPLPSSSSPMVPNLSSVKPS